MITIPRWPLPPTSLVAAVLDSRPASQYMRFLWAARHLEGEDGPLRARVLGWLLRGVEAYAAQIGPDMAREVRDLIRQAEAP